MRSTPEVIDHLEPNEVFVFGSNLAGRHGLGAARTAYEKFGAAWGIGYGLIGQSFAIPTKNYDLDTMDLQDIAYYVRCFEKEANLNLELTYLVCEIGCEDGFRPNQIAPMFMHAPGNVILPASFNPYVDR